METLVHVYLFYIWIVMKHDFEYLKIIHGIDFSKTVEMNLVRIFLREPFLENGHFQYFYVSTLFF